MFRKIIVPKNTKLLLNIPKKFVRHAIEVIAFTIESEKGDSAQAETGELSQQQKLARLKKFISQNAITLPEGYKFNREELYE